MIRFLLLAGLATAAFAQTAPQPVAPAPIEAPAAVPAPAPAPAPRPGTMRVTLTTAEGPILLELEAEKAPVTTANFLRYVDQKRLDGTTFYRASKVPNAPEFGLIQGGPQQNPRRVLPNIAHEPTTKTGLMHTDGTISLARSTPGSANADFFIIVGDMPYMNADPTQPGDNLGYAAFGRVVAGMDVVKRLLAAPTNPNAGPFKGEMLAAPVRIVTARRTR